MLGKLSSYFLSAYDDSNYVLQQKARIIFIICLLVLLFIPVIIAMNIVTGQIDFVLIGPLVIAMGVVLVVIFFLRAGKYEIAAHMVMIVTLAAVWSTLFLDPSKDRTIVLDSITYVPGLLVLTPIIVTRKKYAILLYAVVNLALFALFVVVVANNFKLEENTLIDYVVDSGVVIVFVGILCFQIFKINKTALDRTEEEAKKNEEQYGVIHRLHGHIKEMSNKLAGYSSELSQDSGSFSTQSQTQASALEEITATMEEVSGGIDMVSDSVSNQNSSMMSLSDSIENLSRTISQTADRVNHTLSMTDEVSSVANRGSDILSAMSESFNKVNESSGKMTGIVGMIGDISDKTNLLSLNAAIEAARAGEAGRGFAVVADEISKLADQTAASIKEIDGLIKANVQEIARGMANVEATVSTIMQIIQGVNTISSEIAEISHQMEDQTAINRKVGGDTVSVMNMSDEIKSSMDDQKTSVNEMVKSITGLNEITQAYSEGARNLSVKSRDISTMVQELHDLTSYMDE
jgi:methyl-accepting chemotaxis protein